MQVSVPSIKSTCIKSKFISAALLATLALVPLAGYSHGDVTPQPVDTKSLPQLGDGWRDQNPYRDNDAAIKVGTSAFNQNCARCHGLEAISGGFAPDLRMLDHDCLGLQDAAKKLSCFKDVDNYFLGSIRGGKVRNGAVYMPPFEGFLSQEAMWAIKAYLESRRVTD